jgi:hypothetical protein
VHAEHLVKRDLYVGLVTLELFAALISEAATRASTELANAFFPVAFSLAIGNPIATRRGEKYRRAISWAC